MAINEKEFTYILYFNIEIEYEKTEYEKKTIYLGSCNDPVKLYRNALNLETIDPDKKKYLLKWLMLVEENLDKVERKDMEYAFMQNPETEFSYEIKDMELNIKSIRKF
jgi:hypothetical protein